MHCKQLQNTFTFRKGSLPSTICTTNQWRISRHDVTDNTLHDASSLVGLWCRRAIHRLYCTKRQLSKSWTHASYKKSGIQLIYLVVYHLPPKVRKLGYIGLLEWNISKKMKHLERYSKMAQLGYLNEKVYVSFPFIYHLQAFFPFCSFISFWHSE